MVTCMSTELSFYPVLQGCSLNLEKLTVQHLTPAFRSTGWGKRLTEVKWFLLHCMYVSSDSTATYEILSANCKKPKNTSHPSGMFMSLEPSSLQLPAPSTQKTFLPFYFPHALEPVFLLHSTGSPMKVVSSRWGHFNTSLDTHNLSWACKKGYILSYCIN